MPSCSAIDHLVTPYIDGELDAADRTLVQQHLQRCPPCRSRVVAEQSIRELMLSRKPGLCRDHAPALLRSHCAAAARFSSARARGADRAIGSMSSRSWPSRLAPLAAAASLVVIVGGAFFYQATARSSHLLAAELAADHMKCFAMNAVLGTHDSPEAVQSAMAAG